MGWLDKIFRRGPKTRKYAPTLNGWTPIYSQFGTNIYASDVVQQAVKCIVDEIKKLNPTHVRVRQEGDPVPMRSTVQDVLRDPNPLMTTSEFLEKLTWMLLLNYNAFVIPTYYTWTDRSTGAERRYYDGLYIIQPSNVDFIEDAAGRLFIKFSFPNGEDTTIAYDDCIHLKYNFSVNEYMGGNEMGQPDHQALLGTLELNDALLKGVAKAMNASYSVNGIVKYNTLLDDGKMEKNLREFEEKLRSSDSGFLPVDLKAEYIPIERDLHLIDKDTLEFIDSKILRAFGVPVSILSGDYTKEQYQAFYQKTLEPLIISISQAFTKKLFTKREKAFGNRVELYPKDLVFMTVEQTLEMIEKLSPTGGLYENEKRVALGLRPMPELEGKRYVSLNWVDADIARDYQIGQPIGEDPQPDAKEEETEANNDEEEK